MKYIKKFESTGSKIEKDISDIFVELQDEGFTVRSNIWYEDGRAVTVTISKPEFNTNEIKEYVMMFIDYMTDKFGEQIVFYRGRTTAREVDDTFYANGILVTTYEYPDDIELTALKINVNAKQKE